MLRRLLQRPIARFRSSARRSSATVVAAAGAPTSSDGQFDWTQRLVAASVATPRACRKPTRKGKDQSAAPPLGGNDKRALREELKQLRQQLALLQVRKRMIRYRMQVKAQQTAQWQREEKDLIRCAQKPWLLLGKKVETSAFKLFAKDQHAVERADEDMLKGGLFRVWKELPLEQKEMYLIAAHRNREVIAKLIAFMAAGKGDLERKKKQLAAEIIDPDNVRVILRRGFTPGCVFAFDQQEQRRSASRKQWKRRQEELWKGINPLDLSADACNRKAQLLELEA